MTRVDRLPHVAVPLIVMHRGERTIDRNLVEVRPAEPNQLSIRVGEQTALQQRVIGEVDSRNNMAGMKSHLFGFGEEVVGIAIERHLADATHRHQSPQE